MENDQPPESRVAERGLRRARIAVAIVAALAAGGGLTGIRKSLPYAPEGDESIFVGSAARMAASGSLDPQWFGHPGSTIFYPLALIYTIANMGPVQTAAFPALPAEPMPWTGYTSSQAWYYFAARALTIAYFVASMPLVYFIGRFAFSGSVGVIGALLASVIPLSVSYAQFVRTDSAATFFGLLAMLCILKSLDKPSPRRQMIAGAAVGLAVASRYFMVALAPVWILSHLLRDAGGRFGRQQVSRALLQGLVAAILAFLVVTPYFVLDAGAVMRDVGREMEPTHLGADGLSPLGNLRWYLTWALPQDLSWPIALAALAGLAAVLKSPRRRPLVLAAFVGAFLLVISTWHIHWHRWTIQILPVCCLFAAHGLEQMVGALHRLVPARTIARPPRPVVLLGLLLALLAQPAYQLARHDWQQMGTGTPMQARTWISDHIPAGSKIVQERYGPPLGDLSFDVHEQQSLASEKSLAEYSSRGYQYAIVSSAIYSRFLAEPARYPHQSAFYTELFGTKDPLKIFPPLPHVAWLPAAFAIDCFCSGSQTRGEPTIRIYRLD